MKYKNTHLLLFGLLALLCGTKAWTTPPRPSKQGSITSYRKPLTGAFTWDRYNANGKRLYESNIPLVDTSSEGAVSKAKSIVQLLINFFKHHVRRLLWPGLNKNFDPNFGAPLPETAPLGCPFFGNNVLAGSKEKGPEYFYSETSAKLGHPSTWRFYFMGFPITSVSGSKNVNSVLKGKKFDVLSITPDPTSKKKKKKKREVLFSSDSVLFENDRKKHQFLRRLMGKAFTTSAIQDATAKIVEIATEQLDTVKDGGTVEVEEACQHFSLDVAGRQILGLDLKGKEEMERFRRAVDVYVNSLLKVEAYLTFPGNTLLPSFRARRYLVSKIKEKVAALEENGPDGSTLSAMVFAFDDDSNKKLTLEEIVENSLVLLIAGTETSASTLATAMFLLGLHPEVFEKLVQEQHKLVSVHGETITREVLGNCPYLDAVIHETMRIKPLAVLNTRIAKESMVLDGKQIPKGQAVFVNIRLTHELDPKITSSTSLDPINNFVPDRWLDPETRPMKDFIPFGAGPRRCLGEPLAMAEMRVFLSLVARRVKRFKLLGEGSDKTKPIRWNPSSVIPKPFGGVPIRVTTGTD
mmetsp:Transcript_4250/g.12208  ORF Transcript_4250/g.12208 Transcript_4250/m.12208 type:complete len:579 (-) Transcript_4250:143-1879(-)|eukprot:CAMPEP_0172371470 /NCGR_PEP_ID=MMETSP1060-20121228/43094_1 /TAXON_ID=37318 /ORGANISM="Pseudo-nitzschia pungens, Strain cf. cingulata" /LENGTH=578 /DNA_ID=CAMNT_0013097109 /DNA_START=187 /DNA_END=1923 /DNA_ORIENTATION=-